MSAESYMGSFIEFDERRYPFVAVNLELDGDDWSATLRRDGAPTLELAGEVEDDGRLRLDLRALDEVFAALSGGAVTTYPGGQKVCAAHLDVRELEDGDLLLATQFEFDRDRALDPAEASYPQPRRARVRLRVAAPSREQRGA